MTGRNRRAFGVMAGRDEGSTRLVRRVIGRFRLSARKRFLSTEFFGPIWEQTRIQKERSNEQKLHE
jgi:hypothetical protein